MLKKTTAFYLNSAPGLLIPRSPELTQPAAEASASPETQHKVISGISESLLSFAMVMGNFPAKAPGNHWGVFEQAELNRLTFRRCVYY